MWLKNGVSQEFLMNGIFFSLSFIAATVMIVEGYIIVVMKKQITPLPTRILYGLGVLIAGREKSSQQFLGRTSPKDLRAYASYVLIFGALILISSFVYLFTGVL